MPGQPRTVSLRALQTLPLAILPGPIRRRWSVGDTVLVSFAIIDMFLIGTILWKLR